MLGLYLIDDGYEVVEVVLCEDCADGYDYSIEYIGDTFAFRCENCGCEDDCGVEYD